MRNVFFFDLGKFDPIVSQESIEEFKRQMAMAPKEQRAEDATADDRYPHACPSCGGPAYIGLSAIDCKTGCR